MNASRAAEHAAGESGRIELREGSSLYYSLLWTDDAVRERLLARLSLVHTLLTTLEEVQEPEVAERKVHWWHEELERLGRGLAPPSAHARLRRLRSAAFRRRSPPVSSCSRAPPTLATRRRRRRSI